MLDRKFNGDWETLDFLRDYWNAVFDDKDAERYWLIGNAWLMQSRGMTYDQIGRVLNIDPGAAGSLVSGKNRRSYLPEMLLNEEKLGQPRAGWKWVLECTPKPTNPYPRGVQVPVEIRSYGDILEFLAQFPRVPDSNPNLAFFGVDAEWVERNKPSLFSFLLAFLVGDGGKSYTEYETRARHYRKSAMTTNMKRIDSNYRVLRYVQLGLECLGIPSGEIEAHQLPDGYRGDQVEFDLHQHRDMDNPGVHGTKGGRKDNSEQSGDGLAFRQPKGIHLAFPPSSSRLGRSRGQARVLRGHQ